jgi:ATP-binding cassette subfamily B protein
MTRGQRLRYGAAIAVMALGILFMFVVPEITRGVIDGFTKNSTGGFSFTPPAWLTRLLEGLGLEGTGAALFTAGVAVILLTVLAGSLQYLRGRWAAVASEAIMRRLRDRLLFHLNALPLSFFDKESAGDLVQRCTSDVETVRVFLSAQVVEIGRSILLLVFVTPILFALDVKLAFVTLALMPIVVAYSMFFFGRITRIFKSVDEAEGRLTTVLQENLTGIRVVRSFGRRDFEEAKFARANAEHRDATWKLMRVLALFWSISDLICMSQGGLVLFFGAYWTLQGDLTLGTLVAFTQYSAMVIWPVRQMGRTLIDAGKARVSLKRINEILASPLEEPDAPGLDAPPSLSGALVVEDLGFAFPGGGQVLDGVSFELEAGTSVALVGPPGAGKSMIIELLLRLHDYRAPGGSGSIRFDGHELADLPRALVRKNVAVVMQNPFLYAKTITRNLRVGRGEASLDELFAATSAAAIHDSIEGFDEGYETLLGERGVTLSGGQKQRVAIARALLKEAPFLILDDALSAVDLDTEGRILEALEERRGKLTTILVAHRLSSVRHADTILVLDEGRIVERGSHAELLAQGGRYAHLWQLQTNLQAELAPTATTEGDSHE